MTTSTTSTASDSNFSPGILLVDDGELDEVANVLEAEGLAFTRLRGGSIPVEVAPPRELLIVTPRRLERVRRGSPAGAAPGRPLRIIAVEGDSPAMRRRLRQAGLNLLVRLPTDAEIWRLLISRALYDGHERRGDLRVAVGSSVAIESGAESTIDATESTTRLMDLSNRGCRLQTDHAFSEGDAIEFTIPADPDATSGDKALSLSGQVRRIAHVHGSDMRTLAVVFEADMPETSRTRLTALINRWASGPESLAAGDASISPPIPPCELPSLPDLTLDDETDPPISAGKEIRVQLATPISEAEIDDETQNLASEKHHQQQHQHQRQQYRGRFDSAIQADSISGPVVLIGRDLSAGGMRIERVGNLSLGDRFRLSLHGPGGADPFIVHATIERDDGDEGFALLFDGVEEETAYEIEKLVACLPDVESLEEGEISGLGAILSQIIPN